MIIFGNYFYFENVFSKNRNLRLETSLFFRMEKIE